MLGAFLWYPTAVWSVSYTQRQFRSHRYLTIWYLHSANVLAGLRSVVPPQRVEPHVVMLTTCDAQCRECLLMLIDFLTPDFVAPPDPFTACRYKSTFL